MINRLEHPAAAGIVATLLLLGPLYLNWLIPFQLLIPLPLLMTTIRFGYRGGVISLVLPLLASFILEGGLLLPFLFFVFFGLFPILAGEGIRRGWALTYCSAIAFLTGALTLLLTILLLSVWNGPLELFITKQMEEMGAVLVAALQGEPTVDVIWISDFQKVLKQLTPVVALLLPASIGMGWFLIQISNLLFARQLLSRHGRFPAPLEDFTQFQVPFWLVWPLIFFTLLAWLTDGTSRYIGWNLGLFLTIPYFFQGLAIVQAGFRRFGVGSFFRGMFYAILIVQQEMGFLISLVGLFDGWINFRRRFFNNIEEQ